MWKGRLERQAEYILIAKTSVRKRRSAASRIRELHPHETPAILFWSAGANREYSEWVSGQVL